MHPLFNDRRSGTDRRKLNLPVPDTLDRRRKNSTRRNHQSFSARPWWLGVNYATHYELELDAQALTETESTDETDKTSKS